MFSVQRVETTFAALGTDDIVGTGTGFWFLSSMGVIVFATNRHNLDPTLRFGPDTPLTVSKTRIQLRRRVGHTFFEETEWYTVATSTLIQHPSADVALLAKPTFILTGRPPLEDYGMYHMNYQDIADSTFFESSVSPMDVASFVGFPGQAGHGWWDQRWQTPIARSVNVASIPTIPFHHSEIPTTDAMLVSGLSFSGSSGSPVFLHQKGLQAGVGISAPYTPPKVIGIMSGHWRETTAGGLLAHSGLSYLTRSTAIHELLYETSV